jgi:hypothetical protein
VRLGSDPGGARVAHTSRRLEGVKKSPSPVILSEAKNLHLFVFKKIKADSPLRSE